MASGSAAYKKRRANYANAAIAGSRCDHFSNTEQTSQEIAGSQDNYYSNTEQTSHVIVGSQDDYYASTEKTSQDKDRHNSHIYDGLISSDNGVQDDTYEETATIQTTHSGRGNSPDARQTNADNTPNAPTRGTTSNEKVFVVNRKHLMIGGLFTLVLMFVLVLVGSLIAYFMAMSDFQTAQKEMDVRSLKNERKLEEMSSGVKKLQIKTEKALQSRDEVETLRKLITSQNEQIEALKADTRSFSESISEMHNEIGAARARAYNYSDAQSKLSTELRNLKMKSEKVVLFEVYGYNSSLEGLAQLEVIRLAHVKVNEGNAYNSSTGFFTAPVNGLYTFYVQFCIVKGGVLYVEVCVDDCIVTTTAYEYHKNNNIDPHFCFTTLYSHKLVKEQRVYLRNLKDDGTDNFYINFSGILLREI